MALFLAGMVQVTLPQILGRITIKQDWELSTGLASARIRPTLANDLNQKMQTASEGMRIG
jgi:hypothetical protein